jgi:Tfp pilus assembly protein PilV
VLPLFTAVSRGFSVVEVLIATLLLTMSLASFAQVLVLGIRATTDAHDATHALLLAAQKIEELRASPFPEPIGELTDSIGAYDRRWTVESLPADPANTVVMAVTVVRRGAFDRNGVRLVTVRTRRADE